VLVSSLGFDQVAFAYRLIIPSLAIFILLPAVQCSEAGVILSMLSAEQDNE
jgi:hypothetical protein